MTLVSLFLLWFVSGSLSLDILGLYRMDEHQGIERLVLSLAFNESGGSGNHHSVTLTQTQCGDDETAVTTEFISDSVKLGKEINRLVVVGGCGHQTFLPQITCSSSSYREVINLQPTFLSLFNPTLQFISSQGWSQVTFIISPSDRSTSTAEFVEFGEKLATELSIDVTFTNILHVERTNVPVLVTSDSVASLCQLTSLPSLVIVLNSLNRSVTSFSCLRSTRHVLVSPVLDITQETWHSFLDQSHQVGTSERCLYDIMTLVAKAKPSTNDLVRQLAGTEHSGLTGRILFNRDATRMTNISFTALLLNGTEVTTAVWSPQMGLNISDDAPFLQRPDVQLSTEWSNHRLALMIVMCSLGFVVLLYTLAIVIFNCLKAKDRTIKLTSPNINLVTCVGYFLMITAIPLFTTASPLISEITSITKLRRAGEMVSSLGTTIVFSSILVKTWRVHYIFKRMHVSRKGTKDEHLLIIIVMLLLADMGINIAWILTDPISCTYTSSQTSEGETKTALLCVSRFQFLWSLVLLVYKLAIIIATLYYAWNIRNVKLPSLQDSQFLLASSAVVMCTLPITFILYCVDLVNDDLKASILSSTNLVIVISTISLLQLPKILLLREQERYKNVTKFLFSESLQKRKEKEDHESTSRWSCLQLCQSHSGSTMGDSVLSQEIEALKLLVKEKESTIRELTDRLFFGGDRFQEYIHEKTHRTSSRSSQDSYDQPSHPQQRSRSAQGHRLKPDGVQHTGRSSSTYNGRRTQTHQSVPDTSTRQSQVIPNASQLNVSTLQLHGNLPTINEHCHNHQQSVIELERCSTPTTDSAINMSPSNSSQSDIDDDNCFHDKKLRVKTIDTSSERLNSYRKSMAEGRKPIDLYSIPDLPDSSAGCHDFQLAESVVGNEVTVEFVIPRGGGSVV